MNTITKIACRTIGAAGIGIPLYNAMRVGNQFARNEAQRTQGKYLEKAYFDSRTIDTVSYSSNKVRQKVFDLETKNPLPTLWGKIKGWTNGTLSSLGDSLPTIICASMAILSKGFFAKVGAVGVALSAAYSIARNGFGLGKYHPMD